MSVIAFVIQCYIFVVFAYTILSILVTVGAVSLQHPLLARLFGVLHSLTNPLLAPIRNALPAFNGIDFSPMILLVGLQIIRSLFY